MSSQREGIRLPGIRYPQHKDSQGFFSLPVLFLAGRLGQTRQLMAAKTFKVSDG
jgi:hypothetical protein